MKRREGGKGGREGKEGKEEEKGRRERRKRREGGKGGREGKEEETGKRGEEGGGNSYGLANILLCAQRNYHGSGQKIAKKISPKGMLQTS